MTTDEERARARVELEVLLMRADLRVQSTDVPGLVNAYLKLHEQMRHLHRLGAESNPPRYTHPFPLGRTTE